MQKMSGMIDQEENFGDEFVDINSFVDELSLNEAQLIESEENGS